METPASGVLRYRKPAYIVLGTLAAAMLILSFVQLYVMVAAPDPQAYGSIQPDNAGLPRSDQNGAFLELNDNHSPAFVTNLVQLLSIDTPEVVDSTEAAHLQSTDPKDVLIQATTISTETSDYRLYIIGDQQDYPMSYTRGASGTLLRIKPKSGVWRTGDYQVDVPTDGMFGGRDYYQFTIDQPAK